MSAEDGGGASTSAEDGTTLEKVRKSGQLEVATGGGKRLDFT